MRQIFLWEKRKKKKKKKAQIFDSIRRIAHKEHGLKFNFAKKPEKN